MNSGLIPVRPAIQGELKSFLPSDGQVTHNSTWDSMGDSNAYFAFSHLIYLIHVVVVTSKMM